MITITKETSVNINVDGCSLIRNAKKIGKGRFATVYSSGLFVCAFVKDCQMKEAISLWGDQENPHVPKIKKLGEGKNDTMVYQMPVYHKLTASNKTAWSQYKELQNIWSQVCQQSTRRTQGMIDSQHFCDLVDDSKVLTDDLKEAFRNIVDCGLNYGDTICVEIAPRNLMVDDKGNLILLDILFDSKLLPWMK